MSANFPCSICDFVFGNPRELGTHILTAHCNDSAGAGNSSSAVEEIDTKSNITLLTSNSLPTKDTAPATNSIQSYTQAATTITKVPLSAPTIQLTTVPALSKRTGSLLANAASVIANPQKSIGSSTPNLITISTTSRPLKVLSAANTSAVDPNTGKSVPVIHVISPTSINTNATNTLNGNSIIIGTNNNNVANVSSVPRWSGQINNASLVSNARTTVVTGLATASSTKTATILSVTNNNNNAENSINTTTNIRNNNNTNNSNRVLEAKLDPSDSIIMAVDPLERSFNNMHETVPPAQLDLPRKPTDEEQAQQFMVCTQGEDQPSKYICLVCSKTYTSRYNIRMHLNMHTGNNVHTCSYCGRFFAHKHVYESHVRTHTGERPFRCKKCGRAFGDRSNCVSHQKKCKDPPVSEAANASELKQTPSTSVISQTMPSVSMVNSSQVQFNQLNILSQNKSNSNPIVRLNDIQKSLITENNISSSTHATETIIIPQCSKSGNGLVYTENADDDIAADEDDDEVKEITNVNKELPFEEEEEPFHGFDPQIVSVKSISNNNNLDHLNNDSNSAGSSNALSKDIFDNLCELNDDENDTQNDLADIQIEPNIIDFESATNLADKDMAEKEKLGTSSKKSPSTIIINGDASQDKEQNHTSHIPIIPVPAAPTPNTNATIQTKKKQNSVSNGGTSPNITSQLSLKPITELVEPKTVETIPKSHQSQVMSSPMTVQQPPVSSQPSPPPPSTELTCSFCNKKFSSQSSLISHLTSSGHINVPINPTTENIADGYLTYTTASSQNNPQAPRKTRSMCLSCGKTFGKVEQVKIHLNVHYGDNIYTCRFCEKVFTNFTVFDTHIKTHSEEYKFNCKYCNAAFMNRNVMVSHQKACIKAAQNSSTEASSSSLLQQLGTVGATNNQTVLLSSGNQTINNKRPYFKVVLNSDEIKSLIDAKDQEIKIQEAAVKQVVQNNHQIASEAKKPKISSTDNIGDSSAMVIVSEATTTTLNVNPTVNANSVQDDDIAEVEVQEPIKRKSSEGCIESEASATLGGIKPVVRKRAPIFPFEASDHYVPDNNSNNVINKYAINPPPSEAENRQGFCLRQFKGGQQRFICTICGKHYTTTYNMRQHKNIHTGAGLHTCRYCGRDFTHKHVWETHERIHTGERPFKCPHCPKDFADRSNYNSHRKLCAVNSKKKEVQVMPAIVQSSIVVQSKL